jgi:hypothetical protein
MSETAAAREVQDLYPGLIVGKDGKPFASRKAATVAMNGKGIKSFSIVTVDGGFAAQPEKFWRVRFQSKASPNDPEDVMLSVNGETLIIAREKEVIIPDRYRECADHATYPHFRQLPNQPRKIVGRIKKYPYDILGEATEAEYLQAKATGTRKTKAIVAKHGHDVDPETLPENQE